MPRAEHTAAEALQDLGFTALEALVYVSLLKAPGSTGYALARAVSKPVANTYQALESLERRGSAVSENGTARAYRAVPFTELLSALSRDFAARTAQAGEALSRLDAAGDDERVYSLNARDAIVERARTVIASAQKILLIDAFPSALEAIESDLRAAVKRGAAVHVKAYAPFDLPKARVTAAVDGEAVIARWPGTWLNAVADGRETLIALLRDGADGDSYAMWTRSPYLSWVYHSSLSAEITLAELGALAVADPQLPAAGALAQCGIDVRAMGVRPSIQRTNGTKRKERHK